MQISFYYVHYNNLAALIFIGPGLPCSLLPPMPSSAILFFFIKSGPLKEEGAHVRIPDNFPVHLSGPAGYTSGYRKT